MRTLKMNVQFLGENKKEIPYDKENVEEVDGVDDEHRSFIIHCVKNHGLKNGDMVSLFLHRDEYIPATHSFYVTVIDNKTFQIDIPKYKKFSVKNYGTIRQIREVEDENGDIYMESYYTGNAILDIENDFIYYYINNHRSITLKYYDNIFYGYINYRPGENDEDLAAKAIICDRPLEFEEGEIEIYLNWHLIYDKFNTNIIISDNNLYCSIPIGFETKEKYDLCDEQANLNNYMKNILNELVPETIDNEKRQFSPIILGENGDLSYANNIIFNLHFRDRYDENNILRENWKTTDDQFWNGMFKVDGANDNTESDDYLRYTVNGYNDSLGDELNHLGFTEDDIKFSKKKLKKTFIRLLFYSTPNMLSRELLYYSTVFLDTNELFNKYINIKSGNLKTFDSKRLDETLRLSAKFKITNKYDNTKSSEGFYIYLFPSEIQQENKERTIYMKVEFNHAGYGKTIPMILPRKDNEILKSTDRDFPISFIKNENGVLSTNFEKYQDSIMIPLTIKYDNKIKDYIYYFPFIKNNSEYNIELNLFEPRIIGFEGNGGY